MLRLIPMILLLSACERTGEEPDPGKVSIGEAKALDDAAAMLAERDQLAAEPATIAKE